MLYLSKQNSLALNTAPHELHTLFLAVIYSPSVKMNMFIPHNWKMCIAIFRFLAQRDRQGDIFLLTPLVRQTTSWRFKRVVGLNVPVLIDIGS